VPSEDCAAFAESVDADSSVVAAGFFELEVELELGSALVLESDVVAELEVESEAEPVVEVEVEVEAALFSPETLMLSLEVEGTMP
jgi:hypothetical protein